MNIRNNTYVHYWNIMNVFLGFVPWQRCRPDSYMAYLAEHIMAYEDVFYPIVPVTGWRLLWIRVRVWWWTTTYAVTQTWIARREKVRGYYSHAKFELAYSGYKTNFLAVSQRAFHNWWEWLAPSWRFRQWVCGMAFKVMLRTTDPLWVIESVEEFKRSYIED